MTLTPTQILNLANDLCAETAIVVYQDSLTAAIAAASFGETYQCPDPTCRPHVVTVEGHTRVHHDDWCTDLRRRRADAKRTKRTGSKKGKWLLK